MPRGSPEDYYTGDPYGKKGKKKSTFDPNQDPFRDPNKPPGGTNPPGGGNTSSSGGGLTGFVITTGSGQQLSQAELDALTAAYKHVGLQYGWPVSDSMVKSLIRYDVSPAEFTQRMDVVRQLKRNSVFFDSFEQVLKDKKLASKFDFNDRVDFILNRSPAQFYDIWQRAALDAQLSMAGIEVMKHAAGQTDAVSKKLFNRILRTLPAPQAGVDLTALAPEIQQFAAMVRTLQPYAAGHGGGASTGDVATAVFGGKNQAEIIGKLEQIQANQEAFGQERRAGAQAGGALSPYDLAPVGP